MKTKLQIPILLLLAVVPLNSQAMTIRYESSQHDFSDEEKKIIESIAGEAGNDARELLNDVDGDIVLIVKTGKFVIDQTGEVGLALAPGRIQWTVDHERAGGVAAIAKAQLRHTLFHEIHHLARGWFVEGGAPMKTHMDAVISEGMATVFSREYSDEAAPWAEYPNRVQDWAEELMTLQAGQFNYVHWMFLHPDGRQWIGYRVGTYLVDCAMSASEKTPVDLVRMSADDVVALAEGCQLGEE